MTAANYPLVFERGVTFDLAFTWAIDGEVVELEGWSAKLQVRENPSPDSPVIIEFATDADPSIVLSNEGPNVTIHADAEDTADLDFNQAMYDLLIFTGADFTGTVYKKLSGIAMLDRNVTQESEES